MSQALISQCKALGLSDEAIAAIVKAQQADSKKESGVMVPVSGAKAQEYTQAAKLPEGWAIKVYQKTNGQPLNMLTLVQKADTEGGRDKAFFKLENGRKWKDGIFQHEADALTMKAKVQGHLEQAKTNLKALEAVAAWIETIQ